MKGTVLILNWPLGMKIDSHLTRSVLPAVQCGIESPAPSTIGFLQLPVVRT